MKSVQWMMLLLLLLLLTHHTSTVMNSCSAIQHVKHEIRWTTANGWVVAWSNRRCTATRYCTCAIRWSSWRWYLSLLLSLFLLLGCTSDGGGGGGCFWFRSTFICTWRIGQELHNYKRRIVQLNSCSETWKHTRHLQWGSLLRVFLSTWICDETCLRVLILPVLRRMKSEINSLRPVNGSEQGKQLKARSHYHKAFHWQGSCVDQV